MLIVVVKATSIRQASMELQIERPFSFRFAPLSVFFYFVVPSIDSFWSDQRDLLV
jgi:hypothetical protein